MTPPCLTCEAAKRLGVSRWHCVEHGDSLENWAAEALKIGRKEARELNEYLRGAFGVRPEDLLKVLR